jgi:hypothetical protein
MTKIENTVSIEQGELLTINKNLLTIAPEYQGIVENICKKN